MPFGINNPFPTSVASECKKAGKVSLWHLTSHQDISHRLCVDRSSHPS